MIEETKSSIDYNSNKSQVNMTPEIIKMITGGIAQGIHEGRDQIEMIKIRIKILIFPIY